MELICLGSLLEVEDNHQAGLVIWKHFKYILKMGKEDTFPYVLHIIKSSHGNQVQMCECHFIGTS